jgi:2'-hydroxyisoflavone reductase
MRLLVLGGTRFVGRHVVDAALAHEHQVTLLNRGRSAPGLFGDAVEELRGDRVRGDVAALRGRSFDAVVDATAYRPAEVDAVLDALGGHGGPYAFISSVSVYAEPIARGSDEEAPLIELGATDLEPGDSATAYGGLKVACERRLPSDALVVRPGVVAGPHDPTERVTRWARRAGDGDALLASDAQQPVQLIDARDLAAFLLDGVADGVSGTFNVVTEPVSFGAFLAAAGAGDRVVWAGRERLAAAGVALWDELPMTTAAEDEAFLTFSNRRARTAGLRTRPLAQTLADIREWDATRPDGERGDPFARREAELLAAFAPR